MKKTLHFYIVLAFSLGFIPNPSIAQIQDNIIDDPGDIAIVTFHGGVTTQALLAFVLLDNCPANTIIKFSDEEYLTSTSAFASTSEGELAWTNNTGATIARGTVIRIESVAPSFNYDLINTSLGNTVRTTAGFGMNTNDQVYAFIGTMAAPTFLTAFGNLACTGGSAGCIPLTLTAGTTARNVSTASPNHQTYYTGSTTCNGTIAACANMIYTGTWSLSTGITSYPSDFTGSVLPIELSSFEGRNNQNQNLLTWQTASESNNKGFDIEASQDGVRFEKIGFVKGNGTTKDAKNYNFTDKNVASGLTYYRLKQLDFDGSFEYSKIISIQVKGAKSKLAIYPNPVSNVLTVATEDSSNFQVFNLLGQMVLTGQNATSTIDVSALPQGTYLLKMGAEQVKFIKQ